MILELETLDGGAPLEDALCYRLFDDAERVRWRVSDIPWSQIERDKVKPQLVTIVRDIVYSELTTFSATQKFMQAFSDDVDFTQWISVWFYEETKHPHVLMYWLRAFGEVFSTNFMLRGRVSEPFMPSRLGTLVSNIISEITASNRYRMMAQGAEPVLARIGKHLSSDEARHASVFYLYAQRYIERAARPDEEQLMALKVLHLWLGQTTAVQHPVNMHVGRVQSSDEMQWAPVNQPEYMARVRTQACHVVGNLVGRAIERPADVMQHIRELVPIVRRRKSATDQPHVQG
ncbi:MAG TPA: ferritin family protein [Polyangiaceae bacterium]|nr:ferritin family protein [Polyangiaceae bacterium]